MALTDKLANHLAMLYRWCMEHSNSAAVLREKPAVILAFIEKNPPDSSALEWPCSQTLNVSSVV